MTKNTQTIATVESNVSVAAKVSKKNTKKVAQELFDASEVVSNNVVSEKGYTMEGNIVKVKGYTYNVETKELVRKGEQVTNVMPRFHEEVLAVANAIGNDHLKSLCVAQMRQKMSADEKKAKSKERRQERRELVKLALEKFNAKVNGVEIV